MQTYNIFGLHEEQIERLKNHFGDAVSKVEENSIHVDLSEIDAHNLIHDGFFLRATHEPKGPKA